MQRKIQISVTLRVDQLLKLNELKRKGKIDNISETIRNALDEYLKKLDKDIKERGANG